jgi:Protein of unknown function (DUF1566)
MAVKKTVRALKVSVVVVCTLVVADVGRADAPTGRYQFDADTVYDTKTKLTWQRAYSPNTMTQTNAIAYCLGLDLNGLGWRLPTVKEISSLVDMDLYEPAIDPVFTDTPGTFFWSSSPVAGPADQGFSLDFGGGFVGIDPIISQCHARCVR